MRKSVLLNVVCCLVGVIAVVCLNQISSTEYENKDVKVSFIDDSPRINLEEMIKKDMLTSGCLTLDKVLDDKKDRIIKSGEKRFKKGNSLEEYANILRARSYLCGTSHEQTPGAFFRRLHRDLNLTE